MRLFFQLLRDNYTNNPNPKFREPKVEIGSYVYGPFDDMEALDRFATPLCDNEKREMLVFQAEIRSVRPDPRELPEDQKRDPGNEKNWAKSKTDDTWTCNTCGALIQNAHVAHPIWVSEGAGFGECQYEDVGYCPNCEKKPNFHGHPVRENGQPW